MTHKSARDGEVIVLVSCGKKKKNVPSRADQLYISPLFKKSRLYAIQVSDKWFIMSAKHGLLRPNEIIEPYDLSLSDVPKIEKNLWADNVCHQLLESAPNIEKVILLGGADYTEPLRNKLSSSGLRVETPLVNLSLGKRLSWLSSKTKKVESLNEDLELFYSNLKKLTEAFGLIDGFRIRQISSSMIPEKGVYFFLDENESGLQSLPRVVRIGTHGVSINSKSTLKQRLLEHIGSTDGYGNHRSSIFRQYVGWSYIRKNNLQMEFREWNNSKVDKEVLKKERSIEYQVSRYIGNLKLLFLNVPGDSSSENDRSYLEKNTIALLSSVGNVLTPPSMNWLGSWSEKREVIRSGLWNVDYTFSMYDHKLNDLFSLYTNFTLGNMNYNDLLNYLMKKKISRNKGGFRQPFFQNSLSDFQYNEGDDAN